MNDDERLLLRDSIENEIFLVAGDEGMSELYIAPDWADLSEYMKLLSPSLDSDVKVYHGVLSSAELLPANLRGKSAFAIFQHPEDPKKGSVVDSGSTSTEELATDLQAVINSEAPMFSGITIDHTFILYGYELETYLSVDVDELDDETIDTCQEIVNEMVGFSRIPVEGIE